jgi:hypothetical protein
MSKTAFTMQIPDDLMQVINHLAEKWHLSKTAVIKLAVSKLGEQEADRFPPDMPLETRLMIEESRQAYREGKGVIVSTPEEFDKALNV